MIQWHQRRDNPRHTKVTKPGRLEQRNLRGWLCAGAKCCSDQSLPHLKCCWCQIHLGCMPALWYVNMSGIVSYVGHGIWKSSTWPQLPVTHHGLGATRKLLKKAHHHPASSQKHHQPAASLGIGSSYKTILGHRLAKAWMGLVVLLKLLLVRAISSEIDHTLKLVECQREC